MKATAPQPDLVKSIGYQENQVHLLAMALGLPQRLVQRQPFPGPGLAVRIAGDVTPARLISAIITEVGVARAPYGESLQQIGSAR